MTSSIKLGKLIGVSKDMVILTFNRDGLAKRRFKIDRKEFTPENKNVWIARNQETADVIKAKTAKELAKKINVSESTIVTCRSQKNLYVGNTR